MTEHFVAFRRAFGKSLQFSAKEYDSSFFRWNTEIIPFLLRIEYFINQIIKDLTVVPILSSHISMILRSVPSFDQRSHPCQFFFLVDLAVNATRPVSSSNAFTVLPFSSSESFLAYSAASAMSRNVRVVSPKVMR